MDAGRLDRRVTILRRVVVGDTDFGDHAPVFTVWGNFRNGTAKTIVEAGRPQNAETGALTIRDSAQARTITVADRVSMRGRQFTVDGVGEPDRLSGMIVLGITSKVGGQ